MGFFLLASAIAVMPKFSAGGDTAGALPSALAGAGITERLGTKVDPSLTFTDEMGRTLTLGDFFARGKPMILNFAYYQCPMLCGLVQDGMTKGLTGLDWGPGNEYEILTLSMDSREGAAEALAAKQAKMSGLEKAGVENGWHFLTGDEKSVRSLAEAVGFGFNFIPDQNEYAHGAGLIFLSPSGKVSRYLYGVEFPPRDLRLAILDATEGRTLSLGERIEMFCYRYDSTVKGYVLLARNSMRVGGLVVVGLLMLLLIPLWRQEFRRKRHPVAA